mmetsp:Transcript_71159/g.231141  ORF Transcript_71159/g.231141 Transcript_71159/m.231141 type:complete len:1604 (-) Transcript_71159:138-4949(-)
MTSVPQDAAQDTRSAASPGRTEEGMVVDPVGDDTMISMVGPLPVLPQQLPARRATSGSIGEQRASGLEPRRTMSDVTERIRRFSTSLAPASGGRLGTLFRPLLQAEHDAERENEDRNQEEIDKLRRYNRNYDLSMQRLLALRGASAAWCSQKGLGDSHSTATARSVGQSRSFEMLLDSSVEEFDLEEQFEELFKYKNQYVTGCLLHFAVVFACNSKEKDAESVRLVLEAKANPHAKATYTAFKGTKTTKLEAIHMAAGLGYVPAMEALWATAKTRSEREQLVNTPCLMGDSPHYTAIHDAVYLRHDGAADAAMWLLAHKADPNARNRDGFTPLHWVAFQGLPHQEDLESLLHSLLRAKCDLEAKTSEHPFNKQWSQRMPLEMASLAGSTFPKSLMHLLAPSWHRKGTLVVLTINMQYYVGLPQDVHKYKAQLSKLLSAHPPPDVICVQEGLEGRDELSEFGFRRLPIPCVGSACSLSGSVYRDKASLEGVCAEDRDRLLVNELYIRAEGCKWEPVDYGVKRLFSDAVLPSQKLVPRHVVWAKLRWKDTAGGRSVYILNTHVSGGRFEDRHFQRLSRVRFLQTMGAMEVFDEKSSKGDLGILVGDFNATTPDKADKLVQSYFEQFIKYLPQVDTDMDELGLDEEHLEERFSGYMSSPFKAMSEHGWSLAFRQSEVGASSRFGHLVDHMAVSQAVPTDVPEVFFTTNQVDAPPDTDVPMTDHNAIKVSFHVQPHAQTRGGRSFLDDLVLLAQFNPSIAEEFASTIRKSTCEALRDQVWRDAQRRGAVDELARLLFSAPMAALDLLEVLKTEPRIHDIHNNPISNRTSLWWFPSNMPMKMTYQPDTGLQPDNGIWWPTWKYDRLAEVKVPAWQARFIPVPTQGQVRQDHIYEVDCKVLIIPNILDVDVLMAIARIWEYNDDKLFKKMTVRAITNCLWTNLLRRVYCVDLFYGCFELLILLNWALTPNTFWGAWTAKEQQRENPPLCAPVSTNVLLAAVLRDACDLGCWFAFYVHKWLRLEAPSESPEGHATRVRSIFKSESRHGFWHPYGFFSETSAAWEMVVVMVLAYFVYDIYFTPKSNCDDQQMSDTQQMLLAANVFTQVCRFLALLRLWSGFGTTFLPVMKAVQSQASFMMLSLVLIVFLSICVIFRSLQRQRSFFWVVISLYRGVIFGDGDGLDAMGLKAQQEPEGSLEDVVLIWVMLLSSILVYVIILNILIAVYSTEYDITAKLAENLFIRERAKACCRYLFSLQKIRLCRPSKDYPCFRFFQRIAPLAYFLALVLLCAVPCFATAILLAFFSSAWQAAWMQSDWFPSENSSVHQEDHYLWICHRSDYDENHISKTVETRDLKKFKSELDARSQEHTQGISNRLDSVEARMGQLDRGLGTRLDTLAERTEAQLRRIERSLGCEPARRSSTHLSLNSMRSMTPASAVDSSAGVPEHAALRSGPNSEALVASTVLARPPQVGASSSSSWPPLASGPGSSFRQRSAGAGVGVAHPFAQQPQLAPQITLAEAAGPPPQFGLMTRPIMQRLVPGPRISASGGQATAPAAAAATVVSSQAIVRLRAATGTGVITQRQWSNRSTTDPGPESEQSTSLTTGEPQHRS